jgi:hypothetical protein
VVRITLFFLERPTADLLKIERETSKLRGSNPTNAKERERN